MKKSVKLISTLLMIIMLIGTFSTMCLATQVGDVTFGPGTASNKIDTFQNRAQDLVATIRNIAAIVAVVIIAFLGIKYMLGSVEERAEYKKSFIPLIVGILVILFLK